MHQGTIIMASTEPYLKIERTYRYRLPAHCFMPDQSQTVALCGAAGFVGRAALAALLEQGYCVKALDLNQQSWTAGPRAVDETSVILLVHPPLYR